MDGLQQRAITLSFGLGVVILALKFAAWRITGSAALLSDALESIINVAASAFAMWSLRVARTPPDRDHPYGHGKAEYFSAMLEGVLIAAAAAAIIVASFPRILEPQPLQGLDLGLAVAVAASGVNLLLALYLIRTGKRTESIALEADGQHILTDVYTTAGVLLGLTVVRLTQWLWLDGAIACAVAVNILFTGYSLIRRAVKGLMHETDEALIADICRTLSASRDPAWVSIHKLRAWRSGRAVNIDFHLVLPRSLSLEEANVHVKRVESLLRDKYHGKAEVLVKTEVCRDDDCPECSMENCAGDGRRSAPCAWTPEWLTRDPGGTGAGEDSGASQEPAGGGSSP